MFQNEKINFRCLEASEIDVRTEGPMNQVNKDNKVFFDTKIVLYKTAIACQTILDEVVGPFNWQRTHEIRNGKNYCTVSIWDECKRGWVSKEDVGTEQNFEREKSEASDAFKRACTLWGIGRELYFIKNIHVLLPENMVRSTGAADSLGRPLYEIANGCHLYVSEIYCDANKIPTALRIVDQNNNVIWSSSNFDTCKSKALASRKKN